jgi:DNA-binding SARP family transcriptional activator
MTVFVLGRPVIQTGSALVRPSRRMARVLLGIFALRPNRPLTVEWLIDGLWPDSPPASAAANIRSHIAHLRKLLGAGTAATPRATHEPTIEKLDDGYLLASDPIGVDALWFQRLVREGRGYRSAGADTDAAWFFAHALRLWRGEVLDGVPVPSVVHPQAVFLNEERISAIEELVDVRLALGHEHELIPELKALVVEHPLRERLWHQLLLALEATGRRSELVDTYQRLTAVLDTELGVAPSRATTELHELIWRAKADPDPGE